MSGKTDQCCKISADLSFAISVKKKEEEILTIQEAVLKATHLLQDKLPAVMIRSIKVEPIKEDNP